MQHACQLTGIFTEHICNYCVSINYMEYVNCVIQCDTQYLINKLGSYVIEKIKYLRQKKESSLHVLSGLKKRTNFKLYVWKNIVIYI